MAEVIKKATNKFTKGLVMDFSPENTRKEVLTHALNATLLTFNGNELSLQNDMGNARVETAYLPEGYIPVGTCEYGGIIYIVSYNPLENKSQIGCFPSPERNISSDELGIENVTIDKTSFQKLDLNDNLTGDIINTTKYVLLKNDKLNPGDKFLVVSDENIYEEHLSDLFINTEEGFQLKENPIIALNIVSIEDSGKIVYLNSDIRQYETPKGYKYHILGQNNGNTFNQENIDIDSYRNALSSGYNVFKSKTSGKLAILAELIMIDSYSVTHKLVPKENNEGSFDIVIHTEIEPTIDSKNYSTVPKLKYHYLSNSQGYIQINNNEKVPLFVKLNDSEKFSKKLNTQFLNTPLTDIYEPIDPNVVFDDLLLGTVGEFNFPKPDTYHGRIKILDGDLDKLPKNTYTKFTANKYYRIAKHQITDAANENTIPDTDKYHTFYLGELNAKFYRYQESEERYQVLDKESYNSSNTYYVKVENVIYKDVERDISYINNDLYKSETQPLIASDNEVKNPLIEKFWYVTVEQFRQAEPHEINHSNTLYIKSDENKYTTIGGVLDPDETYYIRETFLGLKSIGYIINREDYPGEIYYYGSNKLYTEATQEEKDQYFNFNEYPNQAPFILYYKDPTTTYKIVTETEISEFLEDKLILYYDTNYVDVVNMNLYKDTDGQLFILLPKDALVSYTNFIPNKNDNYILNDSTKDPYKGEEPLILYEIAEHIPSAKPEDAQDYLNYNDFKLAHIKLPDIVVANNLDLPFKYDYTIIPCMNYGKLEHLAISNTVDFSKLHAFNQSNFTTWKYRIDGDQLRLTFGADIYDTYENDKVDGLILEFYDLWGFAGSIEITDKKSYSGIFTKIISLNTLNAISRKKVYGSNNFKHTVNITESDKGYSYNNKEIQYDVLNGWEVIEESDNDCGTLYSNMLYGVKAYLRRTLTDGQQEFIKKQEFFLYTLPIFNDYYYNRENFNTLEKPTLELMLTYKLEDNSTKMSYTNQESNIKDGYKDSDKDSVDQYLNGLYAEDSLNVTKYYQYQGNSKLYLEVGLLKDYETLDLSYDNSINDIFSCKLQLISDDGNVLKVESNSNISDIKSLLNYYDAELEESVNILKFNNSDTSLSISNLKEYNFITSAGQNNININYNFVVGHKIYISDIVDTKVPATTVCALFHKNSETGNYNYSDFGLYTKTIESKEFILWDKMLYNTGTSTKGEFGICNQIDIDKDNIEEEISSTFPINFTPTPILSSGKLNTGDPLKQIAPLIGKLTFAQPHAHAVDSRYGNTMEYPWTQETNKPDTTTLNKHTYHLVIRDVDRVYGDDQVGRNDCSTRLQPGWGMFEGVRYGCYQVVPRYNLCLNTQNSLLRNSIFESTLEYKEVSDKWQPTSLFRYYTGFSGEQLTIFNEKLLTTMKSVYVYNPDYDYVSVHKGQVNLQENDLKFTSNIISTGSELKYPETDKTSFNDYIYLRSFQFSKYLNNLNEFSKGLDDGIDVNKPQVQLQPGFTYCGTENNPYVVSSLTYNIQTPKEIAQDLEFNSKNLIIIKKEDGTNSRIQGIIDKNKLYGYMKDTNSLISLDVSNYKIDNEGNLNIKNIKNVSSNTVTIELNDVNYESYENELTIISASINYTQNSEELLITTAFTMGQGNILYNIKPGKGEFFVIIPQNISNPICNFQVYNNLSNSDKYTLTINKISLYLEAKEYYANDINDMNYSDIKNNWNSSNFSEALKIKYYDEPLTNPTQIINGASLQFMNTSENSKFIICKFTLNSISGILQKKEYYSDIFNSIITSNTTTNYSKFEYLTGYSIIPGYEDSCIRGSSITLNDLEYIPNKEGHRLFMKDGLCQWNNRTEGVIYYRTLKPEENTSDPTWDCNNYRYNRMFFLVGPSFTVNNL